MHSPLAAATLAVKPTPWAFNPHPDVWLLIAGLVLCYFYATRVVGPRAVAPGEPIITRSQSCWFFSGVAVLWVAVDWPLHDIAEEYLYSAHMVQHLMLTWIVPPMFLIATPEWLARLVLGKGRVYKVFRLATLPIVAGLVYNALFAFSHWPPIVNDSVRWAGFHFGAHTVLVMSALAMWMCVCGPLKELRIALPAQCIYLFLMSVLPTIPGGWLVFAEAVVDKSYAHPWPSLWGLTPTDDQQLAGFIMKVVGGLYLWSIIVVLFFRWNRQNETESDQDRRERDHARVAAFRAAQVGAVAGSAATTAGESDEPLTFDEVSRAFAESAAPVEQHPAPPA